MKRRVRSSYLITLLLFGLALSAQAELADQEQPIYLEADRVLIDDKRRLSQFEGHVWVRQGSLEIRADKLVVREDANGYQQLTAYGTPASFRQRYEGSQEYAEGYGERIEYDRRAETVEFFGKARVTRGTDEVRGAYIAYSTRTGMFEARGNGKAPNHPSGRVHAVLRPKQSSVSSPAMAPSSTQPDASQASSILEPAKDE